MITGELKNKIDSLWEIMDSKADEVICDIKTPRLIQFNYSFADFAA